MLRFLPCRAPASLISHPLFASRRDYQPLPGSFRIDSIASRPRSTSGQPPAAPLHCPRQVDVGVVQSRRPRSGRARLRYDRAPRSSPPVTAMSLLELIASLLGVVAVWLTVRQNSWCWPIGLGMVSLYAWFSSMPSCTPRCCCTASSRRCSCMAGGHGPAAPTETAGA